MFEEVKNSSIIIPKQEELKESVEVNHDLEAVIETEENAALDNTVIGDNEKSESVESNIEINNTEESSAAAGISSLLSTAPYSHLTEDELDIEFEQELLPSIEGGVYPDGCVEKLIRLGELCEVDIIDIEAAYYLRYYYYMIAKYVLEQKYNASKDPNDLARLEAFENKYNSAKVQYHKVRDNSLTLELRLIKCFVDGISPNVELYYGKTYSKVLLKFDTSEELPEGLNLFFMPEADFYGFINSIEITTTKRPKVLEGYSNGDNKAEEIVIDQKHIRFYDYINRERVGIATVNKEIKHIVIK